MISIITDLLISNTAQQSLSLTKTANGQIVDTTAVVSIFIWPFSRSLDSRYPDWSLGKHVSHLESIRD